MRIDEKRLKDARELSWNLHGRRITFYLPGMFTYNGKRGRYAAISITSDRCELKCKHCMGKILKGMIPVKSSDELFKKGMERWKRGDHGLLLSGGCDRRGRLPWEEFLDAIYEVKKSTGMYISIHSGMVDPELARSLKDAGVDQALMDVIGDDDTWMEVYNIERGVEKVVKTMQAFVDAGITIVPHILCGIYKGKIRGEFKAIEIVADFKPECIVIVSLMPLSGTPFEGIRAPAKDDIIEVIVETRFKNPQSILSLGCARRRGDTELEILSIDAGINRMALPSEEAIRKAKEYGLDIRYQKTCCSVPEHFLSNLNF